MELFDTHAHLDDDQLAGDVAGVVQRAAVAGVTSILAVGTTAASSASCLAYAGRFPGVWSSAGIHPNHAAEALAGDWDEIVRLASEPRVVAIGETGLDLHWKDTPLPVQQDYFDRHIRLSQTTGKPLVIHLRESADQSGHLAPRDANVRSRSERTTCAAEILAMLRAARKQGPLTGIMHSYTGTAAQAAEFLDLGLHISFAGMVTFKKSDDLRAVAAIVPADRILVETDSPYLSPEPYRGQRPNEPARVLHTAHCVAQVRNVPLDDFARQSTANARALFRCL